MISASYREKKEVPAQSEGCKDGLTWQEQTSARWRFNWRVFLLDLVLFLFTKFQCFCSWPQSSFSYKPCYFQCIILQDTRCPCSAIAERPTFITVAASIFNYSKFLSTKWKSYYYLLCLEENKSSIIYIHIHIIIHIFIRYGCMNT